MILPVFEASLCSPKLISNVLSSTSTALSANAGHIPLEKKNSKKKMQKSQFLYGQ